MLIAIDTVIAFIVLYVIVDFVRSYVASTEATVWGRLLATGKQSATILVQRAVIAVTGLSGALVWVADYLNAPGVSDAITKLIQPQYVTVFVIGVALVSEFARRRTL